MAEETVASEAKQYEIQEVIKKLQEQFDQLLSDNLVNEKVLRKKKYKVETQLSSWLSKYDNDVGERQAEYDEISQLYEEELREMTDLQEKFDSQEEEYLQLMAEKEEEEQAILEEMVQDFLKNHAARVLQREWRGYKQRKLARKMARKKGKKGKLGAVSIAPVRQPTPIPASQSEQRTETMTSEPELPTQAPSSVGDD